MADDMTRQLWRSLAIVAAVTLVTAWFSALFYFPDEHYQILEFMGFKLGITSAQELPWEFSSRLRPWLQPFFYFLIARPLMAMGLTDMFAITFVLRLVTGCLSLLALAVFAREMLARLEGGEERRAFVRYLPLFGFLPYLFVRTASETLSAALFTLALALVLNLRTPRRVFCAGILAGLAFEARFQSGIMIMGLFAWLAVVARLRPVLLATFAATVMSCVGAGVVVDYWGYGEWVFAPWMYFKTNILEGVAASHYGTEPVFAYFYLLPAQFFAPITLVLIVAMIVMWLRNPRHAVTWVTLPFFLVHMLLGHKEARFLFPMAILATAFPVLAFSPRLPRWRETFARVWGWRRGIAARGVAVVSVLGMMYLAVYPFGIRPHMPMAKYLYRNSPGKTYSFTEPFKSYPLYRAQDFDAEKIENQAQLTRLLEKGPVYLMSATPGAPQGIPRNAKATLLYSEFPFAATHGAEGEKFIRAYTEFAARHGWLKLLPLYWYTLYRVERPATIRS